MFFLTNDFFTNNIIQQTRYICSMIGFTFWLHSFFQCFGLTVFEAWPFFSVLFLQLLHPLTDFASGKKGLTRDESAVFVMTADGGNVVVIVS